MTQHQRSYDNPEEYDDGLASARMLGALMIFAFGGIFWGAVCFVAGAWIY